MKTPQKLSSSQVMARRSAWTSRYFPPTGRLPHEVKLLYVRLQLPLLLSLCTHGDTKLNVSTFFRDMFSLPNGGTGPSSVNDTVNLEGTADVIARMLYPIYSKQYDHLVLEEEEESLGQLHAIVKAHDKFNIETNRSQAQSARKWALMQNPWAALAYASHSNDLELGRLVIQLLPLSNINDSDIWELLSDVKPTWQIALGRLILPKIMNEYFSYYNDNPEDDDVSGIEWYRMPSTGFSFSLQEVAKKFSPR